MSSVYTNLYFNQPLVVLDTTAATPTSGSMMLYGGLSVNGNALLGSTNISGVTTIRNTTESTSMTNGSLVASGGVGISKNLIVGGNTSIIGALSAGSFVTQNMNVTNITTTNLLGVSLSAGTLILSSGLTTSSLLSSIGNFTYLSAGNMSIAGDLSVAGTITTVNITTTNLINTNFSGGFAYVSERFAAIGNSNTLGNIFTTSGNIGINTTNPQYLLDINGNARVSNLTTSNLYIGGNVTAASNMIVNGPALKIPVGNISTRPAAPIDGYIRYNNEIQQFEGFGPGSAWGSLGGVIDIAQTTKILASATPSTTDGNLYFITTNSERMRINSAGNIGIATTSPNYTLDIIGDLGVSIGITTGTLNVIGNTILNGASTLGSLYVTGGTFIQGPELKIPVGNISSRPAAPIDGYIRYNNEIQQFEGFGPGSAWGSLGGVIDIAQTTKILASATPSTTDGNLYFITTNSERMRINSAGNIGIGTTAPNYTLDIIGDLGVSQSLTVNTINVTPSLGDISKELSFSAANNQVVEANVTNFAFTNTTVRSFNATVSVTIIKSSGANAYANYDLKGIQGDTGEWFLNSSFIGDNTDIVFNINNVNNKGQIQYTSTNTPNWVSTTMKFRAATTSL